LTKKVEDHDEVDEDDEDKKHDDGNKKL
jgi:hypothetical protein